ncbi:hypothetical protein AB0J84_09945, partial [Micromonospora arborensis]
MPVAPAALCAASAWRSAGAEAVFGAAALVGATGIPVPPGPPPLPAAPIESPRVLGLRQRRAAILVIGGDFRQALPEFDA